MACPLQHKVSCGSQAGKTNRQQRRAASAGNGAGRLLWCCLSGGCPGYGLMRLAAAACWPRPNSGEAGSLDALVVQTERQGADQLADGGPPIGAAASTAEGAGRVVDRGAGFKLLPAATESDGEDEVPESFAQS